MPGFELRGVRNSDRLGSPLLPCSEYQRDSEPRLPPATDCTTAVCSDPLLVQHPRDSLLIEAADQHDGSLKAAVHPGVLGAASARDSARQACVISAPARWRAAPTFLAPLSTFRPGFFQLLRAFAAW